MSKSIFLLLVMVFWAASCFAVSVPVKAEARIIVVPDDYPEIEAAIANANNGDTIFVKEGTYEGSLNQTLVINKAITIFGEDKNTTTINLSPPLVQKNIFAYYYMSYLSAIQINSDKVKIAGLTINTPGGGISATGDGTQIIDIIATTGISICGSRAIISRNTLKGDVSVNGNNNTIAYNSFKTGVTGPSFYFVGSNNLIINNTLASENETENIKINIEGTNNIVANNLLKAIYLKGNYNIIYKNCMKVTPGDCGIYLGHSSGNTICGNKITYAESQTYEQEGVLISESYDNVVYANHIESVFKGVSLQNTDTEPMVTNNNTFYHNNFVNNKIQAWDTTSSTTNNFDNGKEGNYWSGYKGTDVNNDGIGDVPYKPTSIYTYPVGNGQIEKITECGQDNYPLMSPFNVDSVTVELPELTSPSSVRLIRLISPENATYASANVTLGFTVNKQVSWMGYNLDGQETVTVTGNTTLTGLSNGLHNVTVYAKDTLENIWKSETTYFTVEVPEPFPVTTVAIASTAVATAIGVSLAGYLIKTRRKNKNASSTAQHNNQNG
jgi:nitrous oxidase accessory protein